MTTRLILIRHGEAVCNVERTVQGVATCQGLSPLGHMQAARLAERIAVEEWRADALFVSPIARARQTGEPVAKALGLAMRFDPDVEEIRPGEAEGMTWDQFEAAFGQSEGWMPDVPFAPAAEPWTDFAKRVAGALDRFAAEFDQRTVVIVAHGGVVDASFYRFFAIDPLLTSPVDFRTDNASITEWELRVFNDDLRRWRLVRYNDTAHLRDSHAAPADVKAGTNARA